MKKRILMISLRSDLSGGPKHLVDLMAELKRQDRFEIYFAGPNDAPFGVPLKENSNASSLLGHRTFSLKDLYYLRQFCIDHRIDLIHSHGRGAGLYSRALHFLLQIPVVHTFHGLYFDKTLTGCAKIFLDRMLDRFTKFFIFVSKDELHQAEMLRLKTQKPFAVVPNGVDFNFLAAAKAGKHLTNPIGITLGTLTRKDFVKGVDLLMKNLSAFQTSNPSKKFKLILAGPDIPAAVVPPNLWEVVTIAGPVFPSHCFLASLDIYVSCSRQEGLPLGVLEAMAVGVPCLLSKVNGHNQLIEQEAALGFDLNDENDFCEKLSLLISQEGIRNAIIERAKKAIKENYTLQRMAFQTSEIYTRILQDKN